MNTFSFEIDVYNLELKTGPKPIEKVFVIPKRIWFSFLKALVNISAIRVNYVDMFFKDEDFKYYLKTNVNYKKCVIIQQCILQCSNNCNDCFRIFIPVSFISDLQIILKQQFENSIEILSLYF